MEPVDAVWRRLQQDLGSCRACRADREPPLIDPRALPLFGRFRPWPDGVLFVFEAPNLADTDDPAKRCLTVNPDTDASGVFTHQLLTEELVLDPGAFQVTNAVLCLPSASGGKYPVRPSQIRTCSANLRRQIDVLRPRVVAPLGTTALAATRVIDDHGLRRMSEAVARPVAWFGRWLFPLFHTSMLGRNGRGGRRSEQQRADWRLLRAFLLEHGVSIPAPPREPRSGG